MKKLSLRLFALMLALLVLLPLSAQATLVDWSSIFSDSGSQSGISLIDTEEDEEEPQEQESIYVQQQEPVVTEAPAPVALPDASADTSRIRDDANLFTTAEEAQIAQRIAQFQKNTGMDFVVMTSNRPHEGISAAQLADDFYDYGGFGLDAENSGMAYYIDMYERFHYISTTGAMINYMTDERIDTAINNNTSYLSGAMYAQGVLNMIDMAEDYYRAGIPEGQFQYDVETGQIITHAETTVTLDAMVNLSSENILILYPVCVFISTVIGAFTLIP